MQRVFSGTTKLVIVDLISTVKEYYLLVGLYEEKVVNPKTKSKKNPEKRASKKVVGEVLRQMRRVRPPPSLMTSLTRTILLY